MEDFPEYSFVDELKGPTELGIRRDGSFGAIKNSLGGIAYYVDALGFGNSAVAKMGAPLPGGPSADQRPLGLRFFANTGQTCSNGAPMHEYISTIPKGDLMGKRVTDEMTKIMKMNAKPQGLVPGILEDAVSAANPIPFVKAAQGSYIKCKKVRERVGSNEVPYIRSRLPPNTLWIKDSDIEFDQGGVPYLTRWVFDQYISQKEWDCTPKVYKPKVEGFENELDRSQLFATLLLATLGIAVFSYYKSR